MQRLGQLDEAGIGDRLERGHTKKRGKDITDAHAEQDRGCFDDAFAVMVEHSHDGQGKKSDQPVLPGPIVFGSGTSRHVVDRRRIEGQADGEHDDTGDERREKLAQGFHEGTDQNGSDTADDLGAKDRAQWVLPSDGCQGRQIGKADADDNGQPGAKPAEGGKNLDDSGDRRHQE